MLHKLSNPAKLSLRNPFVIIVVGACAALYIRRKIGRGGHRIKFNIQPVRPGVRLDRVGGTKLAIKGYKDRISGIEGECIGKIQIPDRAGTILITQRTRLVLPKGEFAVFLMLSQAVPEGIGIKVPVVESSPVLRSDPYDLGL